MGERLTEGTAHARGGLPEAGRSASSRARPRPVHLRWSSLALVFLGGTVGVAAREALVLAFPPAGGVPWAVFGINVTGAFMLGLLLDGLARSGPDRGGRRTARLMLGTGLLGGYTTYSALAADTAALIGNGSAGPGILYAAATVLAGGAASWLGVLSATLVRRPAAREEAR